MKCLLYRDYLLFMVQNMDRLLPLSSSGINVNKLKEDKRLPASCLGEFFWTPAALSWSLSESAKKIKIVNSFMNHGSRRTNNVEVNP